MRRTFSPTARLTGLPVAVIALLAVLLSGALAPVRAQGDFSPEEQAALDASREAMLAFIAYDSYTLTVTQDVAQIITFSGNGSTVVLDQDITSEGSLSYRRASGQPFDDRALDLTQTILQTITEGTAEPQMMEVGPNRIRLIAVEGRIYLRMDTPPALAGFFPEGWLDVTEGAQNFPGMEMLDLNGMLAMGQSLSFSYVEDFLNSVTAVELLPLDSDDPQTVLHCRLTVDPAQLMDVIGTEAFETMFGASLGDTIDIDEFLTAMFTSPDTYYALEFMLGADGALTGYGETMAFDADVSAAMIATMGQGVTVTLSQETTQAYRVSSINAAVDIAAPELTAEE